MEKLMMTFLYLIGIFWIVMGTLVVFATELAKDKFLLKLLNIKDLKKFAPIPILVGILLLLSAFYSRYAFLIILLGLLAITKGVLFIVATEKVNKMRDWWLKANDNAYRVWGVVMIILGSIVLIGM
ncbi:MAG: hypothetical protein ISS92_02130 [Candidatus Omnitrophica bacterium]|nr:hypothetical protein [Candidatus Omnitrophota bacterium]